MSWRAWGLFVVCWERGGAPKSTPRGQLTAPPSATFATLCDKAFGRFVPRGGIVGPTSDESSPPQGGSGVIQDPTPAESEVVSRPVPPPNVVYREGYGTEDDYQLWPRRPRIERRPR